MLYTRSMINFGKKLNKKLKGCNLKFINYNKAITLKKIL